MKKILVLGTLSLFGLSDAGAMGGVPPAAQAAAPGQPGYVLIPTVRLEQLRNYSPEIAAEAAVYSDTALMSAVIGGMREGEQPRPPHELFAVCDSAFARLVSVGAYEALEMFFQNASSSWLLGQTCDKAQKNEFTLGGVTLNWGADDATVKNYCSQLLTLSSSKELESNVIANYVNLKGKAPHRWQAPRQQAYILMHHWTRTADEDCKAAIEKAIAHIQSKYPMAPLPSIHPNHTSMMQVAYAQKLAKFKEVEKSPLFQVLGYADFKHSEDTPAGTRERVDAIKNLDLTKGFTNDLDTVEGEIERVQFLAKVLSRNMQIRKNAVYRSALIGAMCEICGVGRDYDIWYKGVTLYGRPYHLLLNGSNIYVLKEYIELALKKIGTIEVKGKDGQLLDYRLQDVALLQVLNAGWNVMFKDYCPERVDANLLEDLLKGADFFEAAKEFKCFNGLVTPTEEKGKFRVKGIRINNNEHIGNRFEVIPQEMRIEANEWDFKFVPLNEPLVPSGVRTDLLDLIVSEYPSSSSSSTAIQYSGEMAGAAEASSEPASSSSSTGGQYSGEIAAAAEASSEEASSSSSAGGQYSGEIAAAAEASSEEASSSSSTADRYKDEMPEMPSVITKPSPKVAAPAVQEGELFDAEDVKDFLNDQVTDYIDNILKHLEEQGK